MKPAARATRARRRHRAGGLGPEASGWGRGCGWGSRRRLGARGFRLGARLRLGLAEEARGSRLPAASAIGAPGSKDRFNLATLAYPVPQTPASR